MHASAWMAESSNKTVLLSYLERNKITIPANTPKSDLEYLREIFLTNFKFESNVLLDITIQRFDAEFNDFIDLEDGDEVFHKDKLKAVVTPILAQDTPEPSSACSEVSLSLSLSLSPSHHNFEYQYEYTLKFACIVLCAVCICKNFN